MKKLNLILGFILLLVAPSFADDLTIGTDCLEIEWARSGSVFYAVCEDGVEVKAGTINDATEFATAPLLIPNGANVASVFVKSSTQGYNETDSIAGSIGNATIYTNISPIASGLVTNTSAASSIPQQRLVQEEISSQGLTETSGYQWVSVPAINSYGTYEIPVGSNRAMKFVVDTANSIAKFSIIVRFDDD